MAGSVASGSSEGEPDGAEDPVEAPLVLELSVAEPNVPESDNPATAPGVGSGSLVERPSSGFGETGVEPLESLDAVALDVESWLEGWAAVGVSRSEESESPDDPHPPITNTMMTDAIKMAIFMGITQQFPAPKGFGRP